MVKHFNHIKPNMLIACNNSKILTMTHAIISYINIPVDAITELAP